MYSMKVENNIVLATYRGTIVPKGYTEIPDVLNSGDDLRFFNEEYVRKTLQECFDEDLLSQVKEADEVFLWAGGKYRAVKEHIDVPAVVTDADKIQRIRDGIALLEKQLEELANEVLV